MQDTAGEVGMSSLVMYSYGPLHIAEQKLGNQLKPTYSSSVWIRRVALRTCRNQWTIGRGGDKGSGISVLIARQDDDDDIYICIYVTLSDIRMCERDIGNPKTRNSRNWFRYETFIHLFELKGFSTWGERDTVFLCWLLLHLQLSTQPTRGARSAQIRLASPSSECCPSSFGGSNSTNCFFSNLSPRFRCVCEVT